MSGEAKVISDGDQTNVGDKSENQQQDVVSYDSHRRLLSEKKKLQSQHEETLKRLQELENQQKEAEERKLAEKEDFKKLLELREKELKEERERFSKLDMRVKEGKKMSSFLHSLGTELDQKYWSLVDLDQIAVNPETGDPDPSSIQEVVEKFKSNFSEVIVNRDAARLPNDSARKGGSGITYDEWLKLPLKEKKERYQEMLASDKNN